MVPQLQQGIVIGGNSPAEKIITGVMIAKIRNVMMNEKAISAFRATATADEISVIQGIGLAIYQIVERLVWGSDYNINTGATKQTTGAITTGVNIDQFITIKWQIEEFDTERFMNSSPEQKATLISGWASSMTTNALINLEAIFLRGVVDYCIAKMPNAPVPTVLKMDLSTPSVVNADEAQKNFYEINDLMIKYQQFVDTTVFGTPQDAWEGIFGLQAWACLSQAYLKIVNMVAADTLATGTLYENTILNTKVATNFYLQSAPYIHGTSRAINLQTDFDFSKLQAVFIHRATWAMPMSFKSIRQIIDPATGNIQWLGKVMFSLPEALYPLSFIILKDYPTSQEIVSAQARVRPAGGTTDINDNLKYTFQLASYDSLVAPAPLSATLTVTSLGAISAAAATPTSDEVIAAAINANPSLQGQFLTATSITATGATITGSSIYTGNVTVTFTVATQVQVLQSAIVQDVLDPTTKKIDDLVEAINNHTKTLNNIIKNSKTTPATAKTTTQKEDPAVAEKGE